MRYYNFINRTRWQSRTAHFTNMIWKRVTKQGCARSADKTSDETVIVCTYTPSGNSYYLSDYHKNVPPIKSCKNCMNCMLGVQHPSSVKSPNCESSQRIKKSRKLKKHEN